MELMHKQPRMPWADERGKDSMFPAADAPWEGYPMRGRIGHANGADMGLLGLRATSRGTTAGGS